MTILLFVLLALLVGALLPAQAGINSSLAGHLGHPLAAALVNFAVGGIALLAIGLALRVPIPAGATLRSTPAWMWLGGLCGMSLVVTAVLTAPKLGATLLSACLIGGQLLSSVLLDHFGLVGYAVRPVTTTRVLGLAVLALGVFLVRRG